MKINMIVVALAITLILICAPVSAFASGSGTYLSPYIVTTPAEWAQMEAGSNTGAYTYYELGNVIDFQSDPSKSIVLHYFMGNLDGKGFIVQNFYNNTAKAVPRVGGDVTTYGVAMFSVSNGNNPGTGTMAIKNIIFKNCTLDLTTPDGDGGINPATSTTWSTGIGLVSGAHSGANLQNIYADENCNLTLSGAINQSHSATYIGGISGHSGVNSHALENIVSRVNINITTSLRTPDKAAGTGDFVGGVYGYATCYGVYNVLSAGTITATGDSYTATSCYDGSGYCYASSPIYFDEDTLSTSIPTFNLVGLPTSAMTNRTRFSNFTFAEDYPPADPETATYLHMSLLSSDFHGYPIPYYFYYNPSPTPVPTPTGTPTVAPTGTPTPTPTFTVVPTTVAPSGKPSGTIKWIDDNYATVTSRWIGQNLTFSFDTVNGGVTPGAEVVDQYLVQIQKKNMQTNAWVVLDFPAFYKIGTGQTSYTHTVGWAWEDYSTLTWKGYARYTSTNPLYPTNSTVLRAILFTGNSSTGNYYQSATADLSLTNNPLLISNFGDWLKRVGGDGLAYLVAVIITLILACIPYLILRRMNVFLEMMMIALGLGISFYAALIPVWVLFGVGVALVAVFILMRNQEV